MNKYVVIGMLTFFNAQSFALELNGQLDWSRRVELSVPVSGVIAEVIVAQGAKVNKGMVLLKLDQRVFKERVNEAKAKEESARLDMEEAEKEMNRAQELFDRTVLSIHELEVAKIAYAKSKAIYSAEKANYVKRETELQFSEIRAPFDGTVIKIAAEVGQSVASEFQATPLIVLADTERLLAKALVEPGQINQVRVGAGAKVAAGSREFRGEVTSIAHEPVNPRDDKKLYEVTIAFDAKNTSLRAGQSVKVELP